MLYPERTDSFRRLRPELAVRICTIISGAYAAPQPVFDRRDVKFLSSVTCLPRPKRCIDQPGALLAETDRCKSGEDGHFDRIRQRVRRTKRHFRGALRLASESAREAPDRRLDEIAPRAPISASIS